MSKTHATMHHETMQTLGAAHAAYMDALRATQAEIVAIVAERNPDNDPDHPASRAWGRIADLIQDGEEAGKVIGSIIYNGYTGGLLGPLLDTSQGAVRIVVDGENPAETWWDAVSAVEVPTAFLPIVNGADEVTVTTDDAVKVRAWAESLPGWSGGPSYAPHPLLFT